MPVWAVRVCGVVFLAVLGGCAGKPSAILGIDNPTLSAAQTPGTTRHRVLVATTRAPSEEPGVLFSGERNVNVEFATTDVFVPPNHQKGQIERPVRMPPDPRREFVVADAAYLDGDTAFLREIENELRKRPVGDRELLVFVHGYNTDMTSAILRMTQFVHDTGFTGVPIVFSWASRGTTRGYVFDINSALVARDGLEHTGRLLGRTSAEGAHLLAHSMGSLLTVEALRQLAIKGDLNRSGRLRHVVLASADIDIDLFEQQVRLLPQDRNQVYLMVSQDDRALALSRRIAGGVYRVGAADAERLAKLGVTVIDLTEIEDGTSVSHAKFASSPDVVKLIGQRLAAGDRFGEAELGVTDAGLVVSRIQRRLGDGVVAVVAVR